MTINATLPVSTLSAAMQWLRAVPLQASSSARRVPRGALAPRVSAHRQPSLYVQAHRARARLAQVRRGLVRLLADDCGRALVLEDVQRLDEQLVALGLEPTRVNVLQLAAVGRECRAVFRELVVTEPAATLQASAGGTASATPSSRPAPLSAPFAVPFAAAWPRWSEAHQRLRDTEAALLQRLRTCDERLGLLMRANVPARRAA